jgi:hypothetical protein
VIGARNDRFGRLDFVEPVTRDLHRTVTDSELGACGPALAGGQDLLINDAATCSRIKAALRAAIQAAAADQATLFVYFLGHGHLEDEDLYLIGSDTPGPEQVDSESAVPIGQLVKEALRQHSTIDGLMLVLDACHVGAAITDPVPGLLRTGLAVRMEILAAARGDETVSRGCFTRSLIGLLNRGSTMTADEYLRAYDEHSRLRLVAPPDCNDMPEAIHVSLRGSPDAGLWLGRNHVADIRPSLMGSTDAAEVARLTRNFVHTPYFDQLMALRLSGQSPIAISGGAGVGKSALLSALGRASVAGEFGLDALVTVHPGETLADIAERLRPQLELSTDYAAAAIRWMSDLPSVEVEATPVFDRVISGPMANLMNSARILVGVDSVDLLSTLERRRLFESFPRRPGAALIVAGREVPDAPAQINLPDRDAENVHIFLDIIVDDNDARAHISRASDGDWLLARILAGLWRAGRYRYDGELPSNNLDEVFNWAFAVAIEGAPNAPTEGVLAILATAQVGPSMPFELLVNAVANYSGVATTAVNVRDSLVALGELVARNAPGTEHEHTGPAHDLIARFFVNRRDQNDVSNANLCVAQTIIKMRENHVTPAVEAYSRRHLSEHLLSAGQPEDALNALVSLETPADTLSMWKAWLERLTYLGPDHPAVLAVRGNIATWQGESGRPREALEGLTALLPDIVRVLGPDHQNTLATRGNIALWAARSGDIRKGLREFSELLADQERLLGTEHPDSLATRGNIAAWTGDLGDYARAVEKATELHPTLTRILGPDHASTLNNRATIALWTGRVGNISQALANYGDLRRDQERILGVDHPDVLATRTNIAMLTAESGDVTGAVEQSITLLHDQKRVFGLDHPYTLAVRGNLIKWTAQSKRPEETLEELTVLLHDHERIVGRHHPYTLTVRGDIARYTAEAGYLPEALEQWKALLRDREPILGANHRDTLATRNNIAVATSQCGNKKAAIDMATDLLRDQEQALGPNHPDTKMTRRNIAKWTS